MPAACRAAATAVALLAAGTALAQQRIGEPVPGLRGAVAESEETGLVRRSYSPISAGALPAEEEGGRTTLDGFADEVLERPAARAGTAERRQTAGTALPQQRPALPGNDDLTTATVRTGSIDALDEERNARAARDNERTGAIEGQPYPADENPYAPLGIRAGSFVVTPTLEQGIGWTSNANLAPAGRSSIYSETGLRLRAISDWSRHTATIDADVNYRKSLAGEEISEIEGGVNGELRLDLADFWSATTRAGYRVRPESASSPNAITGVATRPMRHTLSAGAGIAGDLGALRLRLDGDVVRDVFGDAKLTNGGRLSQRDRDATLATGRVRAGYELSPAVAPFVEAEIGRRFHDLKRDGNGLQRSANRYALRGGVELDLGEKLTGELAAGWLTERPDDSSLRPVEGLTIGGNLAWSPVRGTVVDIAASTEVEGATAAGETGSLLYSGSVAVNRELRSNLTGRALVGLDWRDYGGSDHDLVLRGETSLTWWMNRNLGVTGRLRHEKQTSTLPGRDYDASSVYLGMTMQR